jgi:mono/diheme cytochrome c family protein
VIARWGQATAAAVVALTSMAGADTGLRPPSRLVETGLDAPGVRGFSPQYPLWTDGAAKRRWIWLPPGTAIDATRPAEWDFPVGTKFWKEFSFGSRKVETRFLWRATSREWMAVSYMWNEDGTEAVLAPADGVARAADLGNGKQHAIPSRTDCLACHGAARTRPLGFTALQLSDDRDPNAIHGEPLPEGALSLESLVAAGLLKLGRGAEPVPRPRIATSNPLTRSVLGYLAGNCGSCHSREGDVPAVTPFLPTEALLTDADAVTRALATQATTWQVPGRDEGTMVIDAEAPDASAMLARMRSRRPSSQMPPLGTALRDQEAVAAVEKWIAAMARPAHSTR